MTMKTYFHFNLINYDKIKMNKIIYSLFRDNRKKYITCNMMDDIFSYMENANGDIYYEIVVNNYNEMVLARLCKLGLPIIFESCEKRHYTRYGNKKEDCPFPHTYRSMFHWDSESSDDIDCGHCHNTRYMYYINQKLILLKGINIFHINLINNIAIKYLNRDIGSVIIKIMKDL